MPANDTHTPAAVLILCCQGTTSEEIILTKRTDEVDHHKGQICLPGGAYDLKDKSLWETALRETQEEIGVDPSQITLVRELTPRTTPTGFLVTPFVGRTTLPLSWNISKQEIAELFTVPLDYLKDAKNLSWTKRTWNNVEYLDPLFVYRQHEIWGLTSRILCEFLGHQAPL